MMTTSGFNLATSSKLTLKLLSTNDELTFSKSGANVLNILASYDFLADGWIPTIFLSLPSTAYTIEVQGIGTIAIRLISFFIDTSVPVKSVTTFILSLGLSFGPTELVQPANSRGHINNPAIRLLCIKFFSFIRHLHDGYKLNKFILAFKKINF